MRIDLVHLGGGQPDRTLDSVGLKLDAAVDEEALEHGTRRPSA
ncbi:hypothetical protein [Mesorhizobium delmotii]